MFHPQEPLDAILRVAGTTLAIYLLLLLATRIAGLRSFAKISSFDFAITVAIGSLVSAAIVTSDPLLFEAAVGLVALFAIQMLVAHVRARLGIGPAIVDNRPLMLMQDGQVIDKNLKKAGMTDRDLMYKLREANVLQLSQVRAVVMETTGDVSVLHGTDDRTQVDQQILADVRTGSL